MAIFHGLTLPLKIEALEESVKVIDAVGVVAFYCYVSDQIERRQQTNRLTREQGIELARIFARAVTERAGGLGE